MKEPNTVYKFFSGAVMTKIVVCHLMFWPSLYRCNSQ